MSISFSGLASGMDTSSWVEALVSVKQAEITKLETKKSTISAAQDTLNNIKSYFSSFQGLLENITDARFGIASTDLFSQNLAESSNLSVLSAIATTTAENTTYKVEVNKLATSTEVNSAIKINVTATVEATATTDTRLLDLKTDDNASPLQEGNIVFKIDNFNRTVSVSSTTTIGDFIDSLYGIGIDASYNESTGVFSANIDNNAIFSDATGVMSTLHLNNVNYGYKSSEINVITTITTPATATIGSKLKHFDITNNSDCAFTITNDDGTITNITTFNTESTLASILNLLENQYQIHHEINEDGTISLTSERGGNVFGGRLADILGFTSIEDPYISLSKMTSTDIVYTTEETVINRDATLGELGAITPTGNERLIIKKCDGGTTKTVITSLTENSTVQDLFNTLAEYGITATLNDGVITLNSTTGYYAAGDIATNLGIMSPVTNTYYTTAPIPRTSSENINTASSLGGLGMNSDASVVIYSPVYGIVSVNIAKELTVQQFCDRINDSNYGIKAEIVDSKVRLSELAGSGAYIKGMSTVLQNAIKINVGEDFTYDSTTINVYSNTDSAYIEYNNEAVELNANSKISDINGYVHGNGQILLHQNSVEKGQDGKFHTIYSETTIMVDPTLTLDEFINNPIVGLAQYGITGHVLSDGKTYLTADGDIYLEQITGGSQILTALNLSPLSSTWEGDHIRQTARLSSTVRETTTVAATNSTSLASINKNDVWYDEGTLVFKVNDYYKTVTLDRNDTFGSLIDKMKDVGIDAYITRGRFYVASGYNNVEYVDAESTSNLLRLVNLSGPEDLGGYAASSSPVLSKIVTTSQEKLSASNYAGSSTKLSTVSISTGALTVYRNGQRGNIEISDNDTFGSLQSKLNSVFNDLYIDFDTDGSLRDGKLKIYAKNNDGTINKDVNISIGSTSDKSNFVAITGISVNSDNQLESSRLLYTVNDKTELGEDNLFRASAKKNTLLKAVGISAGNFVISKNGTNKTISITDSDTFESLQTKLQSQFSDLYINFDSDGTLKDGKLQICSTNSNANISVQAVSGNTGSNITSVCNFSSNQSTSSASSQKLQQKVLEGSFKVGNANIYISTDANGKITTSMSDIVAQINASETSLATAYWDNIDGKLVIKSTLTGASAVNIEAGDTNLTDLLGLTNGENLVMDTQTIGSNAVVTINGTRYTSLSNNVTSDSTGLTGLTLNLKGLSNGSTVTLNVKRDTDTLVNAITNVLDRYNELIANIDAAIAKDGKLKDQSMLRLIRNSIRTAMNSADPGSTRFRNLASIGIKASAESNASSISTDNSDITFLSLDVDTFMEAFENYEDDVKALLIGSTDSNGNVINKGILTKVEEIVEGALSAAGGYFDTATRAFNTESTNISQKIVNGTQAIEKYRKRLEHKFSAMDTMIAGMQNQFKAFLG